jgi:hypothetical protein
MNENDHYIKFVGKANIPSALKIGHGYQVQIDGEVTNRTESNNHDGTTMWSYKYEPIMVEITDERGEVIKAKDNRKKSRLLRNCIFAIHDKHTENSIEFDDMYDRFMNFVIANADEIYERAL